MLAAVFLLATTSPAPVGAPPVATQLLAADSDRLEDEVEEGAPPPPLLEQGDVEWSEQAPPPPAAGPTEPIDPSEAEDFDVAPRATPRQEAAPPQAGAPREKTDRFLPTALATAGGALLALPAAGCCFCCNAYGCWAPAACGAAGAGGGAAIGTLWAGVPLKNAWLPILASTTTGLIGGLLAVPLGGCAIGMMLSVLTGQLNFNNPGFFPVNNSVTFSASVVGATVVLVVMAGAAVASGGITWLMLPDELPAARAAPVTGALSPSPTLPAARRVVESVAY